MNAKQVNTLVPNRDAIPQTAIPNKVFDSDLSMGAVGLYVRLIRNKHKKKFFCDEMPNEGLAVLLTELSDSGYIKHNGAKITLTPKAYQGGDQS